MNLFELLTQYRVERVARALHKNNCNKLKASMELGIGRRAVQMCAKKHGLTREKCAQIAATPATGYGSVEQFEVALICKALVANQHNRTHSAMELGISRRTLLEKIRLYGLAVRARVNDIAA